MSQTYKVSWTEENWFEISVQAESESDALQKVENKEYDPTTGTMIQTVRTNYINKII